VRSVLSAAAGAVPTSLASGVDVLGVSELRAGWGTVAGLGAEVEGEDGGNFAAWFCVGGGFTLFMA
jgi:hypothetical protein